MEKEYFVHPTAVVDEPMEIGEGTQIWHFSHIMSGSKIGKSCIVEPAVIYGRGVIRVFLSKRTIIC